MNTVNSFQYHRLSFQHHRLRKRGKLGYNDDEDRDRHVTTAFYLKQFGERSRHDGWYKQFSKCLRTELPQRRLHQVESSGADIGTWNCSIKRRTGSSENRT